MSEYTQDNSVGEAFAKLDAGSAVASISEQEATIANLYADPGPSPTETSGISTQSTQVLSFPSDIENVKYFITFTFYKDEYKSDYFKRPERNITGRVRLPMPNALVETFNMGYSGQALGTVLGYLSQTGIPSDFVNIVKASLNNNEGDANKIIEDARAKGAKIADDLSSPSTVIAGIRATLSTLSSSAARVLDVSTGTALNPFQALFFDGPELRNHNFTFRLSPNSEKESILLKDIIKVFKVRMHPEVDGLLFKYPDTCIIELSSRVNTFPLYTLYRSVLKGMSVNYAPNNVPAFFRNGIDPVEVVLDLSFAEIEPITRKDLVDIEFKEAQERNRNAQYDPF